MSGDEGQTFTFFDHDGNVVREAGTARPSVWKVTNVATGKSYTVNLPAGHLESTSAPDGTVTQSLSGGVIGYNTPADTPAGPFAHANVGRFVVEIAPDGAGTLVKATGSQVDLVPPSLEGDRER